MKERIIQKLKSPVVWMAVIAQVCAIVIQFAPNVADQIKNVATPLISILVLFGVLNDPNSTDKF